MSRLNNLPAASVSTVSKSATTTSAVLLAANPARRGVIIQNNSNSAVMYVQYGATATTFSGGHVVKIAAGAYWVMPEPIYTGVMSHVWNDASDNASVTEIV